MLTNTEDSRISISFLLHDVSRYIRARFDARARAVGVTRQQWRVLMLLARDDGPSQADLAEKLDVEQITLCRMIDRLTEAKLVERRADPNDRRVRRLHLLPAAYGLVERLSAIGLDVEAEVEALLGSDAAKVMDGLTRVRDGLRDESKRSAA